MGEGISRTFIGSVVCVDLVGYSTRSVAQQIAIKDAFNRLLSRALEAIPEEDRIILDTGDGAAISFLGDPEQGLAVGLALRDSMRDNASALGAAEGAEGAVRMGINLGPVKLAVDMNGYPKIIGDGLNVAERIMGFARPGQIAVSRSFVEMVSRLSDENAKLFRFEGARTDKNSREHQVYVVEPGARLGRGGSGPAAASGAEAAAAGPGALVAFLEDRTKVAIAAGVLVALMAGEGYLLARKLRSAAPTVAAVEAPKPAPVKGEPAPKTEAKPAASPRAEPPAPKAEPKSEAKPQPAKAEAPKPEAARPEAPKKEARKDDAAKPADAISPVQPNLVSIAPLNFPTEASARGYSTGSVKARLTIDAAGNVTKVQILSAQPARGFFDEEATRSLRDWKFDRGPANRQYIADIQFKK